MHMTTTSLIFTAVGLITLFYGLYEAQRIRKTLKTGSIKKAWDVLRAFTGVFVLGYIGFAATLLMETTFINPQILTSIVFLLGSMFVAVAARYNRKAFSA
jgi:formate-dependent nitrite reductase membrane component NrfD